MTTRKPPQKFASGTTLTQEHTIGQIRTTLRRYGAVEGFVTGDEPGRAIIGIKKSSEQGGRLYRFDLPMPQIEEYRLTKTGVKRSDSLIVQSWQNECNRRFRALLATIKGRLIAVDEGISTFEEEFAMETVLPDGKTTVREYMLPQIEVAYRENKMPALLPGGRS